MRDPNSDSDKSHNEQQTPTQPPRLGILEYEASDDVKRWARRYRTELASMSSSVLSTFIAVCLLGRLGHWPSCLLMLPMLTVLVQFPLDFAKTRMQSWVDIDNNLRTTAYPIPVTTLVSSQQSRMPTKLKACVASGEVCTRFV